MCPLTPALSTPVQPPVSSTSPGCVSSNPEQVAEAPGAAGAAGAPAAAAAPGNPESEEDKAKKLLYCSLCKVAVNSLSQLEAHNKGEDTPHPTPINLLQHRCSQHTTKSLEHH